MQYHSCISYTSQERIRIQNCHQKETLVFIHFYKFLLCRLQGSINIVVRLKDVNDNAPIWAKNYKPVIPENEGPGPWAQVLEAIDFDDEDAGNGKPISIEWADPDAPNPNFSLESVPGTNKATLRNLRPFDREKVGFPSSQKIIFLFN